MCTVSMLALTKERRVDPVQAQNHTPLKSSGGDKLRAMRKESQLSGQTV